MNYSDVLGSVCQPSEEAATSLESASKKVFFAVYLPLGQMY